MKVGNCGSEISIEPSPGMRRVHVASTEEFDHGPCTVDLWLTVSQARRVARQILQAARLVKRRKVKRARAGEVPF